MGIHRRQRYEVERFISLCDFVFNYSFSFPSSHCRCLFPYGFGQSTLCPTTTDCGPRSYRGPSFYYRKCRKYRLLQVGRLCQLRYLYFGATTIFAEIQSSLNSIWGIKAVPKKSWLKFIKNRILSFSIILVFAFILLITFTITNIIGELSQKFIFKYPEVADSLVKVVGIIINMSVTTIIFTLIFKILPDAKIKSKDVCIGAVVTTTLLLIGQWGISFYIGIANVGTVYGAAAFMVVFVTWIYYSSIIIYTGAEFTKAWANEMGGKIFPDEYAVATKTIEIHEDKPIE